MGVLMPLASWLPGFGGGAGGVDVENWGSGLKLAMVVPGRRLVVVQCWLMEMEDDAVGQSSHDGVG